MGRSLLLGVDVGTTGTRAILYDTQGRPLRQAYEEVPLSLTSANAAPAGAAFKSNYEPGGVEQDPRLLWEATRRVIRGAARGRRVAAIGVTNQRETIIPLGARGEPVGPAIVWQDRRSTRECARLRGMLGERRIFEATGLRADPYFSLPKIMWLKKNRWRVYQKARKWALVHDYIVNRLTGRLVTDHSNASRTLLFDVRRRRWDPRLLHAAGLPVDLLPEPVVPGSPVGPLLPGVAGGLGLPRGTPVVAGAGDQACSALGLGVVAPGQAKITTGTGTFLLAPTRRFPRWPSRHLCSLHALPGVFALEASLFTTGSLYRWLRDTLYPDLHGDPSPYTAMTREAARAPPGSAGVGVAPYFMGAGSPHWDPGATGTLWGLTLAHTRAHLTRAVLESIAYEVRLNIESLDVWVRAPVVDGGLSRAPFFNRLLSEVLGTPVRLGGTAEATSLGAAMLAGIGTGVYRDAEDAVARAVHPGPRVSPRRSERRGYNGLYQQWRDHAHRLPRLPGS